MTGDRGWSDSPGNSSPLGTPHRPRRPTVAPSAVGGEASPGIQVHCTINRTEHDPEFIATLEDFVDDWRQGLERLAGELFTTRDVAPA